MICFVRQPVPDLVLRSVKEMPIFLLKVRVVCISQKIEVEAGASAVDPKVNKSSPVRDVCVSDLLKTNFLSNPSSCAELVDHIRQAGDLGTFSSLSLENQREVSLHLLQKGTGFYC
ncbi:uncharacterized protein Pyn_22153 [Prunus yedoensis var. nudiflora]|uniref:Uncharacterized protein n=1 Tax=Prunus yedoensis var. nudiflora TaxID=2094558 RepID=A0A314UMB2_PRUYE|nr:uncharacterized protein Pyn_22153 [Prunus yedoensis var. nudiflora]